MKSQRSEVRGEALRARRLNTMVQSSDWTCLESPGATDCAEDQQSILGLFHTPELKQVVERCSVSHRSEPAASEALNIRTITSCPLHKHCSFPWVSQRWLRALWTLTWWSQEPGAGSCRFLLMTSVLLTRPHQTRSSSGAWGWVTVWAPELAEGQEYLILPGGGSCSQKTTWRPGRWVCPPGCSWEEREES